MPSARAGPSKMARKRNSHLRFAPSFTVEDAIVAAAAWTLARPTFLSSTDIMDPAINDQCQTGSTRHKQASPFCYYDRLCVFGPNGAGSQRIIERGTVT